MGFIVQEERLSLKGESIEKMLRKKCYENQRYTSGTGEDPFLKEPKKLTLEEKELL